jgi:hypothetical protein
MGGACAIVGVTILAHSPVLFGDDEPDGGASGDRPLVDSSSCG